MPYDKGWRSITYSKMAEILGWKDVKQVRHLEMGSYKMDAVQASPEVARLYLLLWHYKRKFKHLPDFNEIKSQLLEEISAEEKERKPLHKEVEGRTGKKYKNEEWDDI